MTKFLPLLLFALLLVACGDSQIDEGSTSAESNQPEASEPGSTEAGALAGDDRETLRPELDDPEPSRARVQSQRERPTQHEAGERLDREALRERMRERRAEMIGDADMEGRRERLRQRQLQGMAEWWTDSTLAESISLDPDQQQSLSSAHLRIEAERDQLRETLANAQRELMQAARGGEREEIQRLLAQRSAAMQSSIALEAQWQSQLLDTLSDEQLRELAVRNPQLLMGRARTQ